MGVISPFRKAGGSLFTVILFVLAVSCQGQNGGVPNKAKTMEIVSDWSSDSVDWDWAGTSLAFYPAIFVLIGAIVVPITLLTIVIFAIPLITQEGSGRSFGQVIGPTWRSVLDDAQDRVLNSSEQCMERVSCEVSKLATRYSRSLANRIRRDVIQSTWLTPATKIRLSKAIDNSKANKCPVFQCSFTALRRTARTLGDDWDFDSLMDPSEWWNKFVYYYGGRFLWVRKLGANKNVKFYPYLPSVG